MLETLLLVSIFSIICLFIGNGIGYKSGYKNGYNDGEEFNSYDDRYF